MKISLALLLALSLPAPYSRAADCDAKLLVRQVGSPKIYAWDQYSLPIANFGLGLWSVIDIHGKPEALDHEILDSLPYAKMLDAHGMRLLLFSTFHQYSIPGFDGVVLMGDQVVANYSHKECKKKTLGTRLKEAVKKARDFAISAVGIPNFDGDREILESFFGLNQSPPRKLQIATILTSGATPDFNRATHLQPMQDRIHDSDGLVDSISIYKPDAESGVVKAIWVITADSVTHYSLSHPKPLRRK